MIGQIIHRALLPVGRANRPDGESVIVPQRRMVAQIATELLPISVPVISSPV